MVEILLIPTKDLPTYLPTYSFLLSSKMSRNEAALSRKPRRRGWAVNTITTIATIIMAGVRERYFLLCLYIIRFILC